MKTAHNGDVLCEACGGVGFASCVCPRHIDYPHHPGALFGCDACEAQCFCAALNAGQVERVGEPIVCVRCADVT